MMRYVGIVDNNLGVPTGVDWHPSGETIAVCGTGGIKVFSNSLQEEIVSLQMPDKNDFAWLQFDSVAWNFAGNMLAGAHVSGNVVVWDALSWNIALFIETTSFIGSLRWSPNDTRIACAGDRGVVQVWETTTGQQVMTAGSPHHRGLLYRILEQIIFFEGPPDFNDVVTWSPDNTQLAGLMPGNQIRIWEATTYNLVHILKGHRRQPFSISWSPDSTKIASAGLDRKVIIWDVAKAAESTKWKARTDVQTIAWSPDGKKLAGVTCNVTGRAGIYEPTITVWDSSNGDVLSTVENHLTAICDLAWSPDGTRIAAIDGDSIVEIWEVP